jgi:PAS domain S-box-containing protein
MIPHSDENKIQILLVDDLEENLLALGALLRDLNVTVHKARSGVEALELALKHSFALALVDVQMPGMDGFELAELLRGSERTRHIPLIFVTAGSRDAERVFRGYEAGAVDFLYKPIDAQILKSKVQVFIDLFDQRLQLRNQEELFRSTFENAAVGLAHVGLDGTWLRMNSKYCDLLGYSEAELRRTKYGEVSEPEDLQQEEAHRERLLRGEVRSFSMDKRFRKKSGGVIWARLQVSLIRKVDGSPDYFISSAHDVTREKEFEETLVRAKESADEAARAKSEFLANMSHEMRTPLTAIIGFTELLLNGDQDSEMVQQFLSRIRNNGDALLHLIEDILDLSKFESGKMPIDPTPIDLKELVEEVVGSFETIVKNKSIELKMEWQKEIPRIIKLDRLRVRQILMNLISNAVKFTEKGSVIVKARLTAPTFEEALPNVELSVRDSGVGIPADKQEAVFKPFTQADSSITRRFGGTGLGLTLSRRIANAMGGNLELVESAPGVGSLFRCLLPLSEMDLKGRSSRPRGILANGLGDEDFIEQVPVNLSQVKILLAEDALDNVMLIKFYLQDEKAQLDTVGNGLQAVEACRKTHYDLVLMDMQMPVMDGLEATSLLRKEGFKGPILALTAHALYEHFDQAISAGCNGYLSKPFNRKELLESITGQLQPKDQVNP